MTTVLQIYKNYFPVSGGIEGHIRLLSNELVRSGQFEVKVLVTNLGRATTREVLDGVEVIKAGENITLARTPISWKLWREVSRTEADITHLHFPYPFGELGYLLFGKSRKMVITYHSDIVSQKGLLRFYEPFLLRALKRADRIIATSPRYIKSSPYLSKFQEKCAVVPLSVDIDRFQSVRVEDVERVRRAIEERSTSSLRGSPLVLFVGKLRYYKGLPYIIEAMKAIPGRLLIVGTGPVESSLRAQVKDSHLEDKVLFLGELSDEDLPAHYHASDVFVLPSTYRSEAFGLVQVEAMACGKPLVCTELGTGTSWVNLHGETGLVVEPANSKALADAVNTLLGDAALRQHLGKNASERARREFSKESMVARIAELYNSLASEK